MRLPPGVMENDINTLRALVAQIFQDSQKTVAAHRKLVINLKNLKERAVSVGIDDYFNRIFISLVNRVLPIKKSETCGDRVFKLVEAFAAHLGENGEPFVELVIKHLLRGIDAKDKTVRYRVCQLIALLINSLGELDDDLFEEIRDKLCRRMFDKEQTVRLQAALALSRLQGVEEDGESDQSDHVTDVLLTSMQHDSSADVRRAILFNIVKNRRNLPFILERAWDTSSLNRKSFYSRTMKEIGDFRLLSISQRERILQWGLKDRDPAVKAAATNMLIGNWLPTANNDLVELLERLDVINSKIADTAMKVFFEQRKDTLAKLEFDDEFWQNLTAESVFLARAYNEYCVEKSLNELIEQKMPELTKLAFLIEMYIEQMGNKKDDEVEFIVEQLLTIAETYDFGDEIGRRKTLGLLRDVAVQQNLNDVILKKSVEIIRKIAVNERDFSQVLLELISDIRDTVGADGQDNDSSDSPDNLTASATTEAKERELITVLKCLSVAQSGLELIEKPLETNIHLKGLLDSLVFPAVRSRDAPVRERGLRCLGLGCLLSKELASETLMLFHQCYAQGDESLKMEAIKIITDILMIHGTGVLDIEEGVDSMTVYKLYFNAVKDPDQPEVQALAAEALCKLLLGGVFTEEELIKALVLVYFNGDSAYNIALTQTLTYCLPVYCFSSAQNQKRMAAVVVDSLRRLTHLYNNDDDKETLAPTHILAQLLDWTDPLKLVSVGHDKGLHGNKNSTVQLELAIEIVDRIQATGSKDERRALCGGLSKLYIPATEESVELIKELLDKVENVSEDMFLGNFFLKLTRSKSYRKVLQGMQLSSLKPDSLNRWHR